MIHLECDNDEAVAFGLGFARATVRHSASKGRVSKSLQKAVGSAHVGLMDQDPGYAPPPYLREFKIIEAQPKLSLVRYQHPKEMKCFVEIQPDLEPWLYQAAKVSGLKPKDYYLPERHEQLHDNPKVFAKRLSVFVAELLKAQNPHLCLLQQWLKH